VAASAMSVTRRVVTSCRFPAATSCISRRGISAVERARSAGVPAAATSDTIRADVVAWKRVRSVWVTIPTSRPASTIGRWPSRRSIIVCSTSEPMAEEGRVIGSAVMISATGVSTGGRRRWRGW
jgi:hypothetical protein